MQYIYGLPVFLSRPHYPSGEVDPHSGRISRYSYAREFYFLAGNDPQRISFLGRLPAVVIVVLLVLATGAFARSRIGATGSLLAASLVAFMPDVLAHGGVAYNDVPLALAFLLALWAMDAAFRQPSPLRGGLAGVVVALTIGVKFSGGAACVAGVVLLFMEAVVRSGDFVWRRRILGCVLVAVASAYCALVLIYRGDPWVRELLYGLRFTSAHVTHGHDVPAFLAGRTSLKGWPYFYPVAFLIKTPVAFHALALATVLGLAARIRKRAGRAARDWLSGPLRPAWVGACVFTFFLLISKLDLGFRYALPAMVLAAILVAAGMARLWAERGHGVRLTLLAFLLTYVVSVLRFYPDFLAYTSEYNRDPDRGHELLVDSSLDWGQGLLELKSWMRNANVKSVYLGYFGSALPSGYGIRYISMPSFFPLPQSTHARRDAPAPEVVVISATLLEPLYLPDDPYARFRRRRPDVVLGHTLFVYKIHD